MGGLVSHGALKDLFARHREGATGTWILGTAPQRKVLLEAGQIVYASSTHPQDRLTHLLVERGRITQAQMDYALANLQGGMSIGKNLLEMGFITQRDLLEGVRAQLERVVDACLAEPADLPTFESGPLDPKSLRMPLDTAALLLHGLLALRDRELLLNLLGSLNQVLIPRRQPLPALACPSDLVPLLDGLDQGRTLEELIQASGTEPYRAGALLLLLRDMGWVDFQASPDTHLSKESPALEPEARLASRSEAPDLALPIHQDLTILTQELPPLPEPDTAPTPRRPWVLPLVALGLAAGGWGAWIGVHRITPPPTVMAPSPIAPVSPGTSAPTPPAESLKPEPAASTLDAPTSRAQRLEALLRGDLKQALIQGLAHQKTLPGRWTLRLEIACQPTTLQRAAEHLQGQDADVFVLPRTLGDGRACYQLFFGAFASEAEAREAIKRLPPAFLADGNRPRPLPADRVDDFQ